MTKGVLLFALNNSEINYIKLAQDAAIRIQHFLKVPVSLITDADSANTIVNRTLFDNIIIVENENYHIKRFHDGEQHWLQTCGADAACHSPKVRC